MTLPTYLESAMQPLLRGIVEVMCSWREWFNDSQVKRAQELVEEVERSLRERIFQMNFVEQLYYARTIHSFSEDLVRCQGSLELIQSSLAVPGLAALLLNVGRSPDVGLCKRNGAFFVVVPVLNAMVCEGGVMLPHNPAVMAEVFQEIDSSFSHLDSLNQHFLKLFRQTALLKGKSHTDAYPCYFQLNYDKNRERRVFLTEEERVLDHERAFVRTMIAGRISDSSLGDIEGHRQVKSLAETNRTFTHSSTVTERSCLCLMEGVPSVELAEGVEALLAADFLLLSQKIEKLEGRDGSKSIALSEVDLTSDVYTEDELRSFNFQVSRATTIEKELPAVLKETATEIMKASEKIKKREMAFDRTHSQTTAESQTLDRFSEDQSEDLVVNSSDQQTAADAYSELLRVMSGVVNVAAVNFASERQPVADASFERQPVANASFEWQPVADALSELQPVADASFERQPVANASFEWQPVADALSELQPVANGSFERQPVADAPFERQPVANASFERQPVGDASFERQPVADASFERQPVADASSEPQPVLTCPPPPRPQPPPPTSWCWKRRLESLTNVHAYVSSAGRTALEELDTECQETICHAIACVFRADNAVSLIGTLFNNNVLSHELLGVQDKHGNTPLHNAVMSGDAVIVREFVRLNLPAIFIMNYEHATPLDIAVSHRNNEVVECLLKICVASDPHSTRSIQLLQTSLLKAMKVGYTHYLKILLELHSQHSLAIDFECTDCNGYTAWHYLKQREPRVRAAAVELLKDSDLQLTLRCRLLRFLNADSCLDEDTDPATNRTIEPCDAPNPTKVSLDQSIQEEKGLTEETSASLLVRTSSICRWEDSPIQERNNEKLGGEIESGSSLTPTSVETDNALPAPDQVKKVEPVSEMGCALAEATDVKDENGEVETSLEQMFAKAGPFIAVAKSLLNCTSSENPNGEVGRKDCHRTMVVCGSMNRLREDNHSSWVECTVVSGNCLLLNIYIPGCKPISCRITGFGCMEWHYLPQTVQLVGALKVVLCYLLLRFIPNNSSCKQSFASICYTASVETQARSYCCKSGSDSTTENTELRVPVLVKTDGQVLESASVNQSAADQIGPKPTNSVEPRLCDDAQNPLSAEQFNITNAPISLPQPCTELGPKESKEGLCISLFSFTSFCTSSVGLGTILPVQTHRKPLFPYDSTDFKATSDIIWLQDDSPPDVAEVSSERHSEDEYLSLPETKNPVISENCEVKEFPVIGGPTVEHQLALANVQEQIHRLKNSLAEKAHHAEVVALVAELEKFEKLYDGHDKHTRSGTAYLSSTSESTDFSTAVDNVNKNGTPDYSSEEKRDGRARKKRPLRYPQPYTDSVTPSSDDLSSPQKHSVSERVKRQRKRAKKRILWCHHSASSESDSSKQLNRRSCRPQGTVGKHDESVNFSESAPSSEEHSLTDSALSDSATSDAVVEKRQLLSLQKLAKLRSGHKSNGNRQPILVSRTQTITVNTFFCADGTFNKMILKRISSVIHKVGYHHLRYEIHQQLFPVFGFSPLKRALTGRERKIAREIVDVVGFKRCSIPSNIVENLEVLEKVLKDRERQDQVCADHERGKKRPAKSAAPLAPAKSQTAKPPKRSTGREPLEDTEPDDPLTPSPTDTTPSISCGSAKLSASITTTTQSPAIPILNLLTHSEEKKQGVNDSEVYGSTTHTPVHIAADSPLLDESTELCTNNSTNIAVDVPLLDGYTKQCATNTTNTAADSGLLDGSTKQCATNTAADSPLLDGSTKLSATNTTNSELVSYNPSATTTASTHSPPSCREEESSGLSVLEFTNSSNPLNVIHIHMKRFSQCCPRHDIKNIVTIGTTYPPSDAFGPKRRYSSIKDIQSDPSHSEFDFTKKLSAQSSSNRHYRDSESNQIMFERPSPESVLRQNRGVLSPKPSLAHSLMETTEPHPSLPLSSRQHTSQLHPPTQSLVPQPSKNSEAAVATTTNRETSIENHQGNTESARRLENVRSSIPSRSSTSFADSQTAPEDHKERLRSAAELLHAQDYTRILPLAYEGKPPSIPPVHQIPYVFITALAYYKLSSHKKSVHFFTECLRLAGECGRDGDITICNIYIGDIEFAKRRYSEAAGRYQTALHHYSRESVAQEFRMVMPTRSAVWLKCGSAFKNASRVGDSVAAYEKAIELAASKKDQLSAHTSLGNLFQGIGENGRAVKEYEAAIKLAQELEDHVSLGWNHGNLGNALLGLHQRDKALHHLFKALDMAVEFETTPQAIGRAYNNLGTAFQSLNELAKAEEHYDLALAQAIYGNDIPGQARVYGNIGNLQMLNKQYDRAVPHYTEVMRLSQDKATITTAHHNRGCAYYDWAEKKKRASMPTASVVSRGPTRSSILNVSRNSGDRGKSRIGRSSGQKRGRTRSSIVSRISAPRSIASSGRDLEIKGEQPSSWLLTESDSEKNCSLGSDCEQNSTPDEEPQTTESYFRVSLHGYDFERCEDIYRPHVVSSATQKYFLQGTRDLEYVIKHHEDNFSGIKGSSKGLSLSVSLFETNSRTFHRMQDCLVHIQKGDDQPIRFEDALLVAEQSRARTLGELMLKRRGPQLEHELMSPPSLFQIKSIVGRQSCPVVYLSYTGERLLGWLLYPTTLFDGQSSSSINMFEVPLSDNDFDGKSFDYHLRYSLNEQLVEKSFEMYKPFDHEKDKTEPLEKLYDLVARPVMMMLSKMDDTHPQQRSAEKMVTQHERGKKKEGVRKIVVIPDSYTNLLPFTCVLDKDTGRFWGDKFYFQIMPSLLTMGILDQLPTVSVTIPVPYQQMLCVVGNPNIPRFTFNNEDWDLGKLPHATKEAEWVSHILQCNPILHEQATKEAVLMRIMNAKVIHLATHGSAVAGFLAFAGMTSSSSEAVKAERVLIYPEEIESLNISPALVVLSSCDSGRGVFKADGIQGMARAFILAGAQAVLTALWRVPDESACIFMQFFYQYLVEGMRGTEALHKAILCLRCFSKYSQYIHWSGYQLTGREFQFSVSQSSSRAQLATRLGTSSVFPRLDVLKELETAFLNNPRLPTDVQVCHPICCYLSITVLLSQRVDRKIFTVKTLVDDNILLHPPNKFPILSKF